MAQQIVDPSTIRKGDRIPQPDPEETWPLVDGVEVQGDTVLLRIAGGEPMEFPAESPIVVDRPE